MKYLPNLLTVLRIILLIPYIYSLCAGKTILALIIFSIAGFTDCLDGYLARQFAWTSKAGAILDPLADKLLMISSFAVLYIVGAISIYIPAILIFRDLSIILGVAYIYLQDPEVLKFEPLFISKLNTVLQLLLIFIILINISLYHIATWFVQVITLSVIITSTISLVKYIKLGRSWLATIKAYE